MFNNIIIKDIIDEDYVNYKLPSMFIATSKCTFKCEKEDCNVKCQNSPLTNQPNITVNIEDLVKRYVNNPLTKAIVFGGLEPFDQFLELLFFIQSFRCISSHDIVIYTGYTEFEIGDKVIELLNVNKVSSRYNSKGNNIIIKYGRFKANENKHFDEILGIELASSNQYAKLYEIK